MKVSVVTPSFNQGQFIERTLQSVASQTGAEIEHVVFDGGSTDETVAVLKKFGSSVRWVSQPDEGQADAVNKGIHSTDGEIIGWLNSDDVYYPGAIKAVVDYFAAHPSVDLVYGMADHIDVNDVAFESYPTEPWNFERLKDYCFICQPALFFRRRVTKSGVLDASLSYCMDYEYWLRLGKAGFTFGYLPVKLAGSRLYSDNKTLGARVKVHREINDMHKRLFGVVPDRWLFNYAHALIQSKGERLARSRLNVPAVTLVSIAAALKWNRRVSFDMLGTMYRWFSGSR